jgi:hypothetical protein
MAELQIDRCNLCEIVVLALDKHVRTDGLIMAVLLARRLHDSTTKPHP